MIDNIRIQTRRGIWETNSSSTHTLSIYRHNRSYDVPDAVTIDGAAQFGWEFETIDTVNDRLSYLYQMHCMCGDYNEKENTPGSEWNFIIAILKAAGVKVVNYAKPAGKWDYGYIDHAEELKNLYVQLLADSDLLLGFIFNPRSVIYTGNDNDDTDVPHDESADLVYFKGN